jgi:hypothetical protein
MNESGIEVSVDWVHVTFGTLWTGIDLFVGFVVGPVLRTLPVATRRAVLNGLIPRTLMLMPKRFLLKGLSNAENGIKVDLGWIYGCGVLAVGKG